MLRQLWLWEKPTLLVEVERERLVNQSSTRIHLSDTSNKPTSNRFNVHPDALSWPGRTMTAAYAMTSILISVVDDDASVRKTTKLLIESFGYRAVVFESAETFLKSGQLNDTSCLVVDVQMQGMNGLLLQSHLASEGCSIPIIFISAYGNKESRRQAMQGGAIAFLDKPFRDEQLLKSIRSALKQEKDGTNTI